MEQWYISNIDPNAAELARKYGLGLEIADFCIPWNMDDSFPQTDEAVKKAIEGVPRRTLHGPFNELFPCAIDPQARALAKRRFKQAVNLAERYGVSKVVLHGGFNERLYYPCWYTEQSILFWKDFAQEIPENVTVCLENVLEGTPDMLLDIVEGTDSDRIGLCLDVGHVNAYSEVPVSEWIRLWSGRLSHLHIHNNDGSADTHSSLTEGTLSIPDILTQTREISPDATFTLELSDAEESVEWLVENGFFK